MIERYRRTSGKRFTATVQPRDDGEFLCLGCNRWRPMHFGGAPDARCDDCATAPLALSLRAALFAALNGIP